MGELAQPASTAAIKINDDSDSCEQSEAATRKAWNMVESGFWIFLVEAGVAGLLFTGLIWWVVSGTGERDRKLREADEKLRAEAEAKSRQP